MFAAWYASERTLSIHTIVTTRREAFHWLTVLFTFALGTAAGDFTAEQLAVGYFLSAVLFAAFIGLVALAHLRFGLGPITPFWLAYILTRPLGASLGDFLSHDRSSGRLGLGTTVTSIIFLAAILAVVGYLTVTRRDVTGVVSAHDLDANPEPHAVRMPVEPSPDLGCAGRPRLFRKLSGTASDDGAMLAGPFRAAHRKRDRMPSNRLTVSILVVLGLVLVIIGFVYFAEPAKSLPGFFPGHESGSTHHHVKHGIAAVLLGLGAFVLAWFQTGPRSRAEA